MSNLSNEQQCCPKFDPNNWDKKITEWSNKRFIKSKVFTLFYMPINFGKVMTNLNNIVENAGAEIPDWLCLSQHTSKWNMDIFLAVDKEIEGIENVNLSGKFYSKVYEGPYKDTGKWTKDFEESCKSAGYMLNKMFMWYTTCPKCAKKYGKNFVVIITQID